MIVVLGEVLRRDLAQGQSDLHVDTNDTVVTLRGTAVSGQARARAAEIARGTEGVTRVVDEVVVK